MQLVWAVTPSPRKFQDTLGQLLSSLNRPHFDPIILLGPTGTSLSVLPADVGQCDTLTGLGKVVLLIDVVAVLLSDTASRICAKQEEAANTSREAAARRLTADLC